MSLEVGTGGLGSGTNGALTSSFNGLSFIPASTTPAGYAITSNYAGVGEVNFWSTVNAAGAGQGFYFNQKLTSGTFANLAAIYGDTTTSEFDLYSGGKTAGYYVLATEGGFFTSGSVPLKIYAGATGNTLRATFEAAKGPEIVGTPTNDSAVAGNLGELLTGQTDTIALTSTTSKTITSVSLTAGDWDVEGTVQFNPAGGTITSNAKAGVNITTDTLPTAMTAGGYVAIDATTAATVSHTLQTGVQRRSLASTTTVYLVAQATFSVSTMTASGFIRARRVR